MRSLFRVVISAFFLVMSGLSFSACTSIFEKEAQAGLQIGTGQIESVVFINGQYLDKAPLVRKNLKPGEYVVDIKPTDEKLSPYQTSVTLRQELLTVITWNPASTPEQSGGVVYEMEPLPMKDATEVAFSTVPDGAIVQLLDKPKEIAPYTFKDIPAGEQEYTVSLPSYEQQKHTINIVPGYRMLISIKLAKQSPIGLPKSSVTPALATGSATASASAVASASATVTILKTNLFVDGEEVLRVRDEPSVTGKEVGLAEVGKSYQFLNEKKDGWFKIKIASSSGWISGTYANLIE